LHTLQLRARGVLSANLLVLLLPRIRPTAITKFEQRFSIPAFVMSFYIAFQDSQEAKEGKTIVQGIIQAVSNNDAKASNVRSAAKAAREMFERAESKDSRRYSEPTTYAKVGFLG
jgi:hypothetical protein